MIQFVCALIDISDPVQKTYDLEKTFSSRKQKWWTSCPLQEKSKRDILLDMDNNTFIHCITWCCCNSKIRLNWITWGNMLNNQTSKNSKTVNDDVGLFYKTEIHRINIVHPTALNKILTRIKHFTAWAT